MHRLKEQETIPAPSDVGGLNKFVENINNKKYKFHYFVYHFIFPTPLYVKNCVLVS